MSSPKDTKGPVVKSGPTKGKNRSRNDDGHWRKKRNDTGKSRDKKDKSGCFITSAACDYRGLADDCYELQMLRSFRDEYLLKTTEGIELVSCYYQEAPSIAASLIEDDDLNFSWREITACVKLIEEGKNKEATENYKLMFESVSLKVQKSSEVACG